jgi:D-3-phosphoglycerate dehydrogenase
MNEFSILITDIAWPDISVEKGILERIGAKLILSADGSETDLLRHAPLADAILTNWKQVPESVVRAAPKLQVISRYGIGVDNIPVRLATELGILVTNVPTYCLDEVSEHTLAMIFALRRKLCWYNSQVHSGEWQPLSGQPLNRLKGQTLGIVGFGKIGQTLCRKALGLGLSVIVYDPLLSIEKIQAAGARKVEFNELLSVADIISLHAPLNPATENMIDERALTLMKSSVLLVNTGRGGLIDHNALAKALKEKRLAGAGLDVFDREPAPMDHMLMQLPNVIITPHIAFYSEESLQDLLVQTAENTADVLTGRRPGAVVNEEVLTLARWSHLK